MLEMNVDCCSVSKAVCGASVERALLLLLVIPEAGMCELRHFSSNRIWITKLPCVLGGKAFGPVVQHCLEC